MTSCRPVSRPEFQLTDHYITLATHWQMNQMLEVLPKSMLPKLMLKGSDCRDLGTGSIFSRMANGK
jgi:hypothetical protein